MVHFKKNTNWGFTLIEVLVSVGLLGTMVLTVANITVNNQNEILRHNAETYADLVASNQFSSLVGLRNQYLFDQDETTCWQTTGTCRADIYSLANGASFHIKLTNGAFVLVLGPVLDEEYPLSVNGSTQLTYSMSMSHLQKADGTGEDPNLVRIQLDVKYHDRGGDRHKYYYTVLGNYLGSR